MTLSEFEFSYCPTGLLFRNSVNYQVLPKNWSYVLPSNACYIPIEQHNSIPLGTKGLFCQNHFIKELMSQQAQNNTCFRNKLEEKYSKQKYECFEGMVQHQLQETSANRCKFCWCNGKKPQKRSPLSMTSAYVVQLV